MFWVFKKRPATEPSLTPPFLVRALEKLITERKNNSSISETSLPSSFFHYFDFASGYLGSSPDPGCEFPAFISPKNTEERSLCSLWHKYDRSIWASLMPKRQQFLSKIVQLRGKSANQKVRKGQKKSRDGVKMFGRRVGGYKNKAFASTLRCL